MRGIDAVSIHDAGKDEPGIDFGGVSLSGARGGQNPRRERGGRRKRAEFAFEQSDERGDGFRDAEAAFGAHALDVTLIVQAGVMTCDGEGGEGGRMVFICRPSCTEDSVLGFGATGAFAS
jgi:hypothetical protein